MGAYLTVEALTALLSYAILAFLVGVVFHFVRSPKVDTVLEWGGLVLFLVVGAWFGVQFLMAAITYAPSVAQGLMAAGFTLGAIVYRVIFSFFAPR